MDPKKLFFDNRLAGFCVFCGKAPETRDHVPSKILLDDPLPDNLAVVECCGNCNNGFSLDEEYVACFLDAVISGSANPSNVIRPKIRNALERNAKLRNRIDSRMSINLFGDIIWTPESNRFQNVFTKLARGHVAYELSEPQFDIPTGIWFAPIDCLSESVRNEFENAGSDELRGCPEIGSRAFLRAYEDLIYKERKDPWIIVQENRYRYSIDYHGGITVRIVMSEYLACEVCW